MNFFAFIKRYPSFFLTIFAICCVLLGISLGISFHDELFRIRCQLIGETFTEVSTQSLKATLESNRLTVSQIVDSWSENKDFKDPCGLFKIMQCYIDNDMALSRIIDGHQNMIFDDTILQFTKSEK